MKKYFDLVVYDYATLNKDILLGQNKSLYTFKGINGDSVASLLIGLNKDVVVWVWSIDRYESEVFEFIEGFEVAKLEEFLNASKRRKD